MAYDPTDSMWHTAELYEAVHEKYKLLKEAQEIYEAAEEFYESAMTKYNNWHAQKTAEKNARLALRK